MLVFYLALNFGIYAMFYELFEIWDGDPRRLIGGVFLLLTYGGFFALVTLAFMLLGMAEFHKIKDHVA